MENMRHPDAPPYLARGPSLPIILAGSRLAVNGIGVENEAVRLVTRPARGFHGWFLLAYGRTGSSRAN